MIICLLNDYELRSVGCDVKQYEKSCIKHEVELFKYPIIEMAPPSNLEQFRRIRVKFVKSSPIESGDGHLSRQSLSSFVESEPSSSNHR